MMIKDPLDDPNVPPFDGAKGMTKEERDACHERWCDKGQASSSLKAGTEEYKMYEEGKQCGFCAFYIALTSGLGMDWGVCGNAKSVHDGKVVFEHFTCLKYEFRPDPEAQ